MMRREKGSLPQRPEEGPPGHLSLLTRNSGREKKGGGRRDTHPVFTSYGPGKTKKKKRHVGPALSRSTPTSPPSFVVQRKGRGKEKKRGGREGGSCEQLDSLLFVSAWRREGKEGGEGGRRDGCLGGIFLLLFYVEVFIKGKEKKKKRGDEALFDDHPPPPPPPPPQTKKKGEKKYDSQQEKGSCQLSRRLPPSRASP